MKPGIQPVGEVVPVLSLDMMKEAVEKDAYVTGVVAMSFHSMIQQFTEDGLTYDGFLFDVLSMRLTGSRLLSDIIFKVVGTAEDGDTLLVEVTGDVYAVLAERLSPEELEALHRNMKEPRTKKTSR